MSLLLDDPSHELTVQDLLQLILKELTLMNERIEEGYQTGIAPDDIEETEA